MFDEVRICPYTGLRSFTEEESIYFKGREEHIQEATKLLEKNKFLMLTGASGDGKSSLVFAGIIPNARSGFLKSQYSNWIVADFRPERSPFENLAKSIAKALQIENHNSVSSELSYGFSALVDLYKNSKFYIDKESDEDEEEPGANQRNAANLLILADQFEEFFTNPENYNNGVTSQESNLCVNLLLETAHLAHEYNLPIYVVCTMRSDYIGQCAAFRGLPEFIGLSQFFVPRLNRKELKEVISEPAVLSGNSISPRLVERLIFDITEGVDQLPMLQHALREIWKSAGNGEAEMDLLHYAMVGGLPEDDLPEDQVQQFKNWFNSLPAKIQECYGEHSLKNVLNTHANKLYETATDYCREHYNDVVPTKDAQHILHNTFVCLTKIDHSRAVRNRMTLKEIEEITDIPGLTTEKVKHVINIFRDSENTLIQPFIPEDGEDTLSDQSVLDITHESLIRNWNLLKTWAEEEYDNLTTYEEFRQQLDRWLDNGKSGNYLLPLGPLSYFEAWVDKIEPNKYWINRYNTDIEDPRERLADSEKKLDELNEYLKKSGAKHRVTRTFMKYGFKRIAAVLAIVAFLLLSSYYGIEKYSATNRVVFNKIKEDALSIIKSNDADLFTKSNLSIELIRKDWNNFTLIEQQLKGKERFLWASGVAGVIFGKTQSYQNPLLDSLGKIILTVDLQSISDFNDENERLSYMNMVVSMTEQINALSDNSIFDDLHKVQITRLLAFIRKQFESPDKSLTPVEVGTALLALLNSADIDDQEKRNLLDKISPFKGENQLSAVFNKEAYVSLSSHEYTTSYGGLYQVLGSFHAYFGEYDFALRSIDSLVHNPNNYFRGNYITNLTTGTNISLYVLQNEPEMFNEFVRKVSGKVDVTEIDFLDRFIQRSRFSTYFLNSPSTRNEAKFLYDKNMDLIGPKEFKIALDNYLIFLNESNIPDAEKVFRKAVIYKKKGIYLEHFRKRGLEVSVAEIENSFDKAVEAYEKVPEEFLSQSIIVQSSGIRGVATRKSLFVHPDAIREDFTFEPREFEIVFTNSSFFDYLVEKNLHTEYYDEPYLLEHVDEWIRNYAVKLNIWRPSGFGVLMQEKIPSLNEAVLSDFEFGLPLSSVVLANELFNQGQGEQAVELASRIKFTDINKSLSFGYGAWVIFNEYGKFVQSLVKRSEFDLAFEAMAAIPKPVNKTGLYAYCALQLVLVDRFEEGNMYLDSVSIYSQSVREQFKPYQIAVIGTLAANTETTDMAIQGWKNFPNKWIAERYMMLSFGYRQLYYEGYSLVDPLYPDNRRSNRYWEILIGSRYGLTDQEDGWKSFDNYPYSFLEGLRYVI